MQGGYLVADCRDVICVGSVNHHNVATRRKEILQWTNGTLAGTPAPGPPANDHTRLMDDKHEVGLSWRKGQCNQHVVL